MENQDNGLDSPIQLISIYEMKVKQERKVKPLMSKEYQFVSNV